MEAFLIRARFVVPAPRLTVEFRGRAARVTVIAALVLLTSYGAPRLVVHAHSTSAVPVVTASAAKTNAPFDVDSVVDRASHTIAPAPGETGTLEVRDAGYRTTFDHSGFTYKPTHATNALSVSLTDIARGEQSLLGNVGAWSSTDNVAQRTVSNGVREQVTSSDGTLEWDVVLAHAPAGTGALTVGANLDGVVGKPARVDNNTAWQLNLAGGAHVTLGETVVKDATGAEQYRALPVVTAGKIVLVVPAAVLTHAAYPLTIDPKVGSRVTVSSGQDTTPAVAFDGTNYLVVWTQPTDELGDSTVFGARVSGDGTFVQSVGQISPTNVGHDNALPDVAWNGSSYLVVWQYTFSGSDIDIHGQRVAANGTLLGLTFTISNPLNSQTNPAVTAAGSTFYVVWEDNHVNGFFDIYGGRVNSAGARLDDNGIVVANDSDDDVEPDVAWNGSNFLVAYDNEKDIKDRAVNTSAVAIGVAHTVSGGVASQLNPALSSHGTEFFVAWEDDRNKATTRIDIYGARLAAAGTVITGNIAISKGLYDQTLPAVAFNGTYLVVWADNHNTRDDIYANRVSTSGAVQDGNGFAVDLGTAGDLGAPAVAPGPGSKWAVEESSYNPSDGGAIYHHNIAPK